MPLLNYTTKIAATKTAGEVQVLLAKAGARAIMVNYDEDGRPSGLAFQMVTVGGSRTFSLPVDPRKVYDVLLRDNTPRNLCTPEQAERIAWRILKDWVEAQLAIIATEMVTLDQVMLPYMQQGERGETVYELYRDQQPALTAGASA
jgi:hypothetical protein